MQRHIASAFSVLFVVKIYLIPQQQLEVLMERYSDVPMSLADAW
jgi:hypothetical protein